MDLKVIHCSVAQNERSRLRTFLWIQYEKVVCIHKYPMTVWTYQLSCFESTFLFFLFQFMCLSESAFRRVPVAQAVGVSTILSTLQSILNGRFENPWRSYVLHIRNNVWNTSVWMHGELALWRPHCSWHLRRERFSTTRYDSPLSALSKDYSFQRLTLYLLPPVSWLKIRGWRRLSVQRTRMCQMLQ
jgi:hypothetical protein